MSLHRIARKTNRWPPGTWFECTDDGCMIVEVEARNNRMVVLREKGIIFPFSEIEEYVMTCMKRGLNSFDKKWSVKGQMKDERNG